MAEQVGPTQSESPADNGELASSPPQGQIKEKRSRRIVVEEGHGGARWRRMENSSRGHDDGFDGVFPVDVVTGLNH